MYTREMILRKGAIAAHAGEKVLIPINMRDGSVLGGQGKSRVELLCPARRGKSYVESRGRGRPAVENEKVKLREKKGLTSTPYSSYSKVYMCLDTCILYCVLRKKNGSLLWKK